MSLLGSVKKRVAKAGSSVKAGIKQRAKEYAEEREFKKGVEKEAREITRETRKKTSREAYRQRRLAQAKVQASQPILPTRVRVARAAKKVSSTASRIGSNMMAVQDDYMRGGGQGVGGLSGFSVVDFYSGQQQGKRKKQSSGFGVPSTAELLGIHPPQPQKKSKKRK